MTVILVQEVAIQWYHYVVYPEFLSGGGGVDLNVFLLTQVVAEVYECISQFQFDWFIVEYYIHIVVDVLFQFCVICYTDLFGVFFLGNFGSSLSGQAVSSTSAVTVSLTIFHASASSFVNCSVVWSFR